MQKCHNASITMLASPPPPQPKVDLWDLRISLCIILVFWGILGISNCIIVTNKKPSL